MKIATAVLVANGALDWCDELVRLCRGAEPLLAADGGANHLARIGLRPHRLIGDLDSVRSGVRAWIGEHAVVERPDQDRTDLDKSLSWAFDEAGLDAIVVLGASGGRLDHQIGNLALLARHGRGPDLVFREGDTELIAVTGAATLPAVPGETWALWTLDPAIRVSASGLRWSFEKRSLTMMPSSSNVAEADEISITAEGGPVLVHRRFDSGAP